VSKSVKKTWSTLTLVAWIWGACLQSSAAGFSHSTDPAPDAPFLQETSRQVPSTNALEAVGIEGSEVFVGSAHGLQELQGDALVAVPGMNQPIVRLASAGGTLWAMAQRGLFRHEHSQWVKVSEEPVADVCEHRGEVIAAVGRRLWRLHGTALEPLSNEDAPFVITRVLSHNESLYVHGTGRLTVFERGHFGGSDVWGGHADESWDWGTLPSSQTRDVLELGTRMIFATDKGLAVLRGMSLTSVRGEQGLPYEDAVCLARGFTNDVWIGTTRGAIRQTGGNFHYFAGKRWLPGDRVNAIAASGRSIYLATGGGLGIIGYEPFTLQKKAAYYERHLEEWGQKRLGFVHKLEWDETLKEFVREASDNDGGYTGDYLAAQAFRFAVTRDPAARREAVNSFRALRWLETMTGIPGFPARAVWAKGERGHKSMTGSGGLPAEWHDTADGQFEWKGDTSSDEICSHFHAVALFLELAAEGEEIAQAKEHLSRIAAHLIGHGWQLVDLDGKPTRWGRWDPEYFNTDEGRYDRGLQSLEMLSFIKTAEAATGEPRFAAAYRQLVEMGYPQNTFRQRQAFPPESTLHFEDQLAFWSYYNLLRYENDPGLRSLYRRGFERAYEMVRIEQQPWYNFVHAAVAGAGEEAGPSLAHLREWPLDLRTWTYSNSQRADLRPPAGYTAFTGGVKAFSPREREPMRWDAWTMQADGGSGGNDVVEPSGWLMAYWMGRYYGFIAAPAATDPALLMVAGPGLRGPGARPYEGPPRPEIK